MPKREPEWLRQVKAFEKGTEIVFGKEETAKVKGFLGRKVADYGARLIDALSSSVSAPPQETSTPDTNDPYTVLDIPSNSPNWLVRLAYREKAKKAHPDVGGSDEEMKKINDAFEKILKERGCQLA